MIQESNPNVYRTMTEIATTTIKEAILKRVYQPGTRLIPQKLEKELNLGRVAIREALRELTGSGLVVSLPNKGSIVAEPSKMEEITEIFEIRYLLEGKAAYMATDKTSIKTLQKLEELNKEMSNNLRNSQEYFLLNREFHFKLYQACGWKFLCQIITQLFDQVLVFRSIYPYPQEDIKSYIEDHQKMLAAIGARDSEKVREMVVTHIRKGFENLVLLRRQKRKSENF